MLMTSVAIAAAVIVALTGGALRRPYTGGALVAWRIGATCAGLSLACFAGAALIEVPEARGLALLLALVALGGMVALKLREGAGRGPTLHAQTAAAQPQPQPRRVVQPPDLGNYTIRTVPHVAHAGVRAADAARSARVRRIMAMEDSND